MLLEQLEFLKGAVRNASEEIKEELEAINEGSILSESISVVEKILADLLHSSESTEFYIKQSEEIITEGNEIQEEIERIAEKKGIKFKYEIGDEAMFRGSVYNSDSSVECFKNLFKFSDDEKIGRDNVHIENKSVLVIGRTPSPVNEYNSYAIKRDDTIYFVDEYDLHEI